MATATEHPRPGDDRTRPSLDGSRRHGTLGALGLAALAAAGSATAAAAVDAPTAGASGPPPAASATTVRGVVTSLHGTMLELRVAKSAKNEHSSSVTILLDAKTRYREGGQKETRSVLHDGERVRVRLVRKAPRPTALVVEIFPPQWTGTLGALGRDGFVLSNQGRTIAHVLLTRATHLRAGGHAVATSVLHDGERVRVTGTLVHGTITARTVVILPAPRRGKH
jgi:hypothetical protein